MKTILTLTLLLVSIAATTFPLPASAGEFVVIVNKGNTATIDKEAVAKIYKGDMKSWADGAAVAPVDLPDDNPIRASFCTEIIGKTLSNMKALWAQNVFSGKSVPPKQLPSDDEVKKFVSSNKGAIGYITSASLDNSVKAVIK